MRKLVTFFVLLLSPFVVTSRADAATITLTDAIGGHYATADFYMDGSTLVLKLTNTASGDVWDPAHVLTGLYFDIAGDPTLTALSATTCQDCITNFGQDPTDVGGEWAFRQATDLAFNADYVVSATGLGLLGEKDLIGSTPILMPGSPSGVDFGITSTNDNPGTNNGLSKTPLISNYVIFKFAVSPSIDLSKIEVRAWQYGSSLSEAVTTPEPATLMLFGPAAIAAFAARRRRARRQAK